MMAYLASHKEIVIALIGLAGVCVTAYFGYLAKIKGSIEKSFNKINWSYSRFLRYWPEILGDVKTIMDVSEVDRFYVLRACNGVMTPKTTTSIYQMHQHKVKPIDYIQFALDDHYRELLRTCHVAPVYLDVEQMPDSFLKTVYESEGVVSSMIVHLHSQDLGNGRFAHTYCSFASHSGQLSAQTRMKCKIVTDRIVSLFQGDT